MNGPAASLGEIKSRRSRMPWVVVALVVVVGTAVVIGTAALHPRPGGSQGLAPLSKPPSATSSIPTPTPTSAPRPTCMPDAEHGKAWRCTTEQQRWQQLVKEQQAAAFKVVVAAAAETYRVFGDPTVTLRGQISARLSPYYVNPALGEVVTSLYRLKQRGRVSHGAPVVHSEGVRWVTGWSPRGGSQLVITVCWDASKQYSTDRSGASRNPGHSVRYSAQLINANGAWKITQELGNREVERCAA